MLTMRKKFINSFHLPRKIVTQSCERNSEMIGLSSSSPFHQLNLVPHKEAKKNTPTVLCCKLEFVPSPSAISFCKDPQKNFSPFFYPPFLLTRLATPISDIQLNCHVWQGRTRRKKRWEREKTSIPLGLNGFCFIRWRLLLSLLFSPTTTFFSPLFLYGSAGNHFGCWKGTGKAVAIGW